MTDHPTSPIIKLEALPWQPAMKVRADERDAVEKLRWSVYSGQLILQRTTRTGNRLMKIADQRNSTGKREVASN